MKGIILCAGKGSRIQPLSLSQPKTLLPVANITILERCIQQMFEAGIDEIGIIINPVQKEILSFIEDKFKNLQISFIFQHEPLGIFHALLQAKNYINNDCFVLMLGDNIIGESLSFLIDSFKGNDGALLLKEVSNPEEFGIATIKNNQIIQVEEKPPHPKSRKAILGVYVLSPVIFEAAKHLTPSARGEYEITDALQCLILGNYNVSFHITDKPFIDVGTIERYIEANQAYLQYEMRNNILITPSTQVTNCTIIGPVKIGDNCKLVDATIGPFVSIQDNCSVINCKIANSILMDGSRVEHISPQITHSILGRESQIENVFCLGNQIRYILGDRSAIQGEKTLEQPE